MNIVPTTCQAVHNRWSVLQFNCTRPYIYIGTDVYDCSGNSVGLLCVEWHVYPYMSLGLCHFVHAVSYWCSDFICISRNEQKLNLLSLFSRDSDNAVSVVAVLQARQPGSQSLLPGRCKRFLFCVASRKAFCPMGSECCNGRDRTEDEAKHFPPCSAEVKNVWSYMSIPSYIFMHNYYLSRGTTLLLFVPSGFSTRLWSSRMTWN